MENLFKLEKLFTLTVSIFAISLFISFEASADEAVEGYYEMSDFEVYEAAIEEKVIEPSMTFEEWTNFITIEDDGEEWVTENPNTRAPFSILRDLNKGDFLVTDSTSIPAVGHSAIAVSNQRILHIGGYGEVPTLMKPTDWVNRYGNDYHTSIYRVNATAGNRAADHVLAKYRNSGVPYSLSTTLKTYDKTYCSKIVWQGYHYGAGQLMKTPAGGYSGRALPYNLRTYLTRGNLTKVYGKSSKF